MKNRLLLFFPVVVTAQSISGSSLRDAHEAYLLNKGALDARWVWEKRQTMTIDDRAFRFVHDYPIVVWTPKRVNESWCHEPTIWSDGGESRERPCVSSVDMIELILREGTPAYERHDDRGTTIYLKPTTGGTCPAAIDGEVVLDRKTRHPIRIMGRVVGTGCFSTAGRRTWREARQSGPWEVWKEERTFFEPGVEFDYAFRIYRPQQPNEPSVWILESAREYKRIHPNLLGQEMAFRRFSIPRVGSGSTLTIETSTENVREYTTESRLVAIEDVQSKITFGDIVTEHRLRTRQAAMRDEAGGVLGNHVRS